ncbi:unnamed protein product [Linum trigynum]|uniref:Amino acid transporter transmembrane domain-containing protein n=1 Tax=Linum trigynum TaxID=586398 RepID=A0AAV2D2C9_9ROSI
MGKISSAAVEEEEEEESPLVTNDDEHHQAIISTASLSAAVSSSSSSEEEDPISQQKQLQQQQGDLVHRTGTRWTAVAHIITAVIGAGVLSLAWAVAQLGWIAGPLSMMAFAGITYVSATILCDCYRYPDPEVGPRRFRSFLDAVHHYLGERSQKAGGVLVQANLFGTAIAYTITSATSIRAIRESNCYHKEGHQAPCNSYGDGYNMLAFGVVQVVMSQIPDFHNMEWLSILAAIMSFAYAVIGFGLGFAKVIENGEIKGSMTGVPAANTADKIWLAFQAIGDIAFAYPYSLILLEIQDTLKSPPAENKTMKKASVTAIFITTFFYLACGCFGYAAFGVATPGNLLSGFGFYEPYWLIDFANACVLLHLVGAYQMYAQPVFAYGEAWFTSKFPDSNLVNKHYNLSLPSSKHVTLTALRLCFRTAYVAVSTGIAMSFPYFNQILGVLGGLNFWPLSIYFPVEMYLVQRRIGAWTKEWVLLRAFSLGCLIVSILALMGSIQGLFSAKFG